MKITKNQLRKIIKENMLLYSLLIGCKSECNLRMLAPEIENHKIPQCVTQEFYDLEIDIIWEDKDLTLQKFREIIEKLDGYSIGNRRRDAVSGRNPDENDGERVYYDDISINIKNIPYLLIKYLKENRTIKTPFSNVDGLGEDELCNLTIYFPIEANENGEDIVLKNMIYIGPGPYHTGGSADHVGHGCMITAADSECNKNFKAVVANIDPQLTPEEPDPVRTVVRENFKKLIRESIISHFPEKKDWPEIRKIANKMVRVSIEILKSPYSPDDLYYGFLRILVNDYNELGRDIRKLKKKHHMFSDYDGPTGPGNNWDEFQ
jgi:hypothetical protein